MELAKTAKNLLSYALSGVIYCALAIYGGLNLQSLARAAFGVNIPYAAALAVVSVLLAALYFFLFFRKEEAGKYTALKVIIVAAGGLSPFFPLGVTAAFIAVFFIWCLASLKTLEARREEARSEGVRTFAIIAVMLNFTAIVHVTNSHTVYFWDTAGFWQQAIEQSGYLFGDMRTFAANILYSLNFRDYNLFPAILPTLSARLFGTSRLIFVLTVVNFYVLPAIYILGKSGGGKIGVFLAFLCLPMIGALSSIGFLDAGGLIFCGLVILLYTKYKGTAVYGLIGASLAGMFLFRRWYLFWAVSFLICACLHQAVLLIRKRERPKLVIKNLAVMGLSCFLPLVSLLHPLATRLLGGGLAEAYAAYGRPLIQDLQSVLIWYGVFPLILVLCFTVLLILRRKYFVIFLIGHVFLTFALFRTIQGHGQQHLLLYAPSFFIILALGFSELVKLLRGRIRSARKLAAVILAMVFLTGFSHVIPFLRPYYIGEVRPFYPGFTLRTRERQDLAELLRLTERLDRLSDGGNNIIGLVSSSLMLNGDILRNAEISINVPMPLPRNFIADYSQVDSRDGVPRYLFFVPYVVVADPVQLHMPPENQTVVTIAHEMFMYGTAIGAAFERLPEVYRLDDGISVYIFRKVRDIAWEEEELFEEMFSHIGY